MVHPRVKAKLVAKKLAKEHILALFEQADLVFESEPALAHHYVTLAREVQMKHKVHMPKECKRKYCKHCYQYIRTGSTGRVRIRNGILTIFCNHCRKFTRRPFK